MIQTAQHVVYLEGGDALPEFRAAALLPLLQSACDRIAAVEARHAYWAWLDAPPDRAAGDRLAALLDARLAGAGRRLAAEPPAAALIVVAPRLGTVSPWASKATDIARNCGIALHRVERVTEFRLSTKAPLLGGLFGTHGRSRSTRPSSQPAPRCCTTA